MDDASADGDVTARLDANPRNNDQTSKQTQRAAFEKTMAGGASPASANADSSVAPSEQSFAAQISPFELLQRDMQSMDVSAASKRTETAKSAMNGVSKVSSQQTAKGKAIAADTAKPKGKASAMQAPKAAAPPPKKPQTRLRDLSLDSPDFERPALQTMSFQHPRPSAAAGASKASKPSTLAYNDYRNHHANPSPFFREGSEAPSSIAGTSFNLSALDAPTTGDRSRQSPARRPSPKKQHLRQHVLVKTMQDAPQASTPARPRYSMKTARKSVVTFPDDLPNQWSGVADLSRTPLTAFDSPHKSTISPKPSPFRRPGQLAQPSRESAPRSSPFKGKQPMYRETNSYIGSGMESVMHSFQAPRFSVSKSKLSKTPAKEAAHLITRDVLQRAALRNNEDLDAVGADSPSFEPPSVVKNWATRGYVALGQRQLSPMGKLRVPDEPRQPSQLPIVQMMDADDEPDSFEQDPVVPQDPPRLSYGHLADAGDDAGSSMARSVANDSWGDSFDDDADEDASLDDIPPQRENGMPLEGVADTQNFGLAVEEASFDDSFADGETVFGAKNAQPVPPMQHPAFGTADEDGMLKPPDARRSDVFQLKGFAAEDMVTLHGGRLLESQPFEASPLAGRDAKYGL